MVVEARVERHGPCATVSGGGRAAGLPSPDGGEVSAGPPAAQHGDGAFATRRARREYDLCERRDELLGGLCSAPAWNILLDLLISEGVGRRLSVTDLCVGSRAPAATAIRYIGQLANAGLLARSADRCDGRRSFVQLTDRGRAVLLQLLSE